MKSFTVTLTEGQGVALLQLLDLAVKGGGMSVARAAVELDQVIRDGAQAALNAQNAIPATRNELLPVVGD